MGWSHPQTALSVLLLADELDSGCTEDIVDLVVRWVHGNVREYPLVDITIQFRGQKHRIEVVVSVHPLILTNWLAFQILLRRMCVYGLCNSVAC